MICGNNSSKCHIGKPELMTQLNSTVSNSETQLRKRAVVRKMIKHYLKVDMTPMVDLGFLLISFFVITTELSKPTVMNLAMPADGPPTDLAKSAALTVLTKGNSIYYYQGEWEDADMNLKIEPAELSGKNSLRAVIGSMQISLDKNERLKKGRDELMMLIKPGAETSYKTVVDLLDEVTISRVKKYALIKQSSEESEWLYRQQ